MDVSVNRDLRLVGTYSLPRYLSTLKTPEGKSFNWLLDKSLLPTSHHNKILVLSC